MRLKIIRIVRLYQAIDSLRTRIDLSKRLSYALVRTKSSIKPVFDAVAEMEKLSPEMEEFERQRVDALRRFAKRKENGDIEVNGTTVLLDNSQGYIEELHSLQNKYKTALATFEKSQSEVRTYINEEDNVEIYKVPFEIFPETISPEILEGLEPMIDMV